MEAEMGMRDQHTGCQELEKACFFRLLLCLSTRQRHGLAVKIMLPISEIFYWELVQRVTVEGLQESGPYPGLTTAQVQYIDTLSQLGGSRMSANVNSFRGTTERLCSGPGRQVGNPLILPDPRIPPGAVYQSYRGAVNYDPQ